MRTLRGSEEDLNAVLNRAREGDLITVDRHGNASIDGETEGLETNVLPTIKIPQKDFAARVRREAEKLIMEKPELFGARLREAGAAEVGQRYKIAKPGNDPARVMVACDPPGDTLRDLQEQVLQVLVGGGFADKRTELEAWTQALASAERMTQLLDKAHEALKAAGRPRGVLGLL